MIHPQHQTPAAAADAAPAVQPEPQDGTILLSNDGGAFSDELLDLALDAITKNRAFKKRARAGLVSGEQAIRSYPELLGTLSDMTRAWIRENDDALGFDPFEIIEALSIYKVRVQDTLDTYEATKKPNPDAIFWPNPDRTPPRSLFDTMLYVQKVPLITKATPVASAGSCFASEVAKNLQQRQFNYVVSESEDEDAVAGVVLGDRKEGQRYASFSAHHGLLFNTPSFRQLAEKAFGMRQTPRLLLPSKLPTNDGRYMQVYLDPFRESVLFRSREAYEANYEKHLSAVRDVFPKSEVFIATPGLNECWEFVPDGSILPRNPHELDIYPLVRHRVLTVEENIANLQGMLDIVRAHNPNLKLILTVSSVPFLATGRGSDCHVVTANGHSKAVLRTAVEEIVKANRDVYYFPSYEMVTTCIESPWDTDQRHVAPAAVARVMELFDTMYVH